MSIAVRSVVAQLSAAGFIGLLITGCGGGGSSSDSVVAPVVPTALSETGSFPTGLAVGSPGDLQTATLVAAAESRNGLRYALDWSRGVWAGIRGEGRPGDLARLAAAVLPMGSAHAEGAMRPEMEALAEKIQRVLDGDTSIDLATVLALQDMFAPSANASCYGPQMPYASHQDALSGSTSGTLPGGDLGIWLEYENGVQPCVAAQLKHRTRGVRGQTMQGLLMTAVMRLTIARSSTLSMPAAGASTDAAAEVQAKLRTVPALATVVVHAASVSLDSAGTTYTYRLALANGESGASARLGEVVMTHIKGSGPTVFNGVMRVSGFTLSNDSAMGCEDTKDSGTGMYQVAHVSTVKYSRDGTALSYGSRNANYCGHPSATTVSDYGAQVAGLTSGAELDPSAKLTGNNRGTSTGWRGNFSRFASTVDKTAGSGNHLFAWQAGTMDNASRMLAVSSAYNSATDTRTLGGYFAFGADIASTDGTLQGMICNWAGPGNSHTPQASFQSQVASHTGSATRFTIASGGSKIAYAPTNSCSSSTTSFDLDANGTLASGEGVGTTSGLDVPSGSNTVQQEIDARGFAKPSLF
jgi:hypothetical protein